MGERGTERTDGWNCGREKERAKGEKETRDGPQRGMIFAMRIRVFWRLGRWTAKRIAPVYSAGIRGDSDRRKPESSIGEKSHRCLFCFSVPTDVYRLRSAPTGPRVIAVMHGDSRLIAIAARGTDLSIYRAIQILRDAFAIIFSQL